MDVHTNNYHIFVSTKVHIRATSDVRPFDKNNTIRIYLGTDSSCYIHVTDTPANTFYTWF
jgi:hypothetical protein